jgi:hypothetical protein
MVTAFDEWVGENNIPERFEYGNALTFYRDLSRA